MIRLGLLSALASAMLSMTMPAWGTDEPQVGTWQIFTAMTANPGVWQLNTVTGDLRLCMYLTDGSSSTIACTPWVHASAFPPDDPLGIR